MRRGFKSDANRIAVGVRKKMNLAAWEPLDPFAVCKFYDIELIPLSRYGHSVDHFLHVERGAFSACQMQRAINRGIVYNDAHHPWRQRSDISHELAHAFLGHAACATFNCDGERDFKSQIEDEAGFLGGCLLITNEAAWHIVKNNIKPGVARVLYGVSNDMLVYRARVSGAIIRGERSAKHRSSH